jgi:hypothetical protein
MRTNRHDFSMLLSRLSCANAQFNHVVAMARDLTAARDRSMQTLNDDLEGVVRRLARIIAAARASAEPTAERPRPTSLGR